MEFFHLLIIFSYLFVALVASHAAAVSSADYSKRSFLNTFMPNGITELFQPAEVFDDQSHMSSAVEVGPKGGGSGGPGSHIGVGRKGGVVGAITTGKQLGKVTNNFRVGVTSLQLHKYRYAATADQLKHSHPNQVTLFFLEKDLKKGTQMSLHFSKTDGDFAAAIFLPRHVFKEIPFLSNNLPDILNQFSAKPESAEAETIKRTLPGCSGPSNIGDERYCATSLESMVDFATSTLGQKVHAVSTQLFQKKKVTTSVQKSVQKYRIQFVKKIGNDDKGVVVCRRQRYVFGVFYCHKTQHTTRTYWVSLARTDGFKVNAVVVCHADTSAWNPKHLAFQLLKVKPGSVPICHFLPEDHVVWFPY